MSLINKMLRDLDLRHAPAVDRGALPGAVHVMRERRPAKRPWTTVALILVLVAVAYLGLVQDGWLQSAAPPPLSPVPPPLALAPVPTPPPVEPVAEPAAALPAEPAPAPAEAAAASPPPAATIGAPVRKALPAPALRKELSLPHSDKAAEEMTPVPVDPSSIDRRPRTAPVNEAAESQYRKAMAALRRGSIKEAQEGFRATLRIDARYLSARQALMSLLVEQQQLAEAQALLEEGLTLDPAQTAWAMALARLQLENGKLAEALETLARHARHAEQSAEYQAFHALLLQKQKRYHDAAERYHAALAQKPAESRWWYGLGLVLELDQKPREAREAFLKARETGNLPPELVGAVEQRLR